MSQLGDLSELINFQTIDEDKHYWMVRTVGGMYFDEFVASSYVAIDWDKIDDVALIMSKDEDKIKKLVSEEYPEDKKPGHAARQIIKFVTEMKSGDIVLIPSDSSLKICIGELSEDNIYISDHANIKEYTQYACPFKKKRRVNWIKTIDKNKLDPYLFKLLNSHHTITEADDYADYIDRSIKSFYRKGDTGHVIFEVEETNNIPAVSLITLIDKLISTTDLFNEITDSKLDKNTVDIKINIQSPGPVELFGNIDTIVAIAVTAVAICGGGLKLKVKGFDMDLKTDGLLNRVLQFIDHIHKNKIESLQAKNNLHESVESLKVKLPEVSAEEIPDMTEKILLEEKLRSKE